MIRRARPDDVRELSRVLARAFDDDPVMSWFFPDPRRRLAHSRRFFAQRARGLVRQEECWTTADLAAAALWAAPERWRVRPLEALAMARFLPSFGRRIGQVLAAIERIEQAHPPEPHYYLAVLGTEPARQGEGLASALLQPVLESCDVDEIPAFLESSKERNIAFYARHGFRVTGEVALPDGPPVWLMWRDPRP